MPSRRLVLSYLLAAGSLAAGLLPAVRGAAQSGALVAPDFTGIDGWLNTAAPLSLAALRGKVVLVDFWTHSCINCRRTVPYPNRWQARYGAQGLQVVGIHTPEFGFEHTHHNVADAVRGFGISFPVGQDNDFRTWRAWSDEAWPAFYLLDRDGRIVLVREGEGHAHEMEAAIRALLGLPPSSFTAVAGDDPDLSQAAARADRRSIVAPEVGDRLEVGGQAPRQPHHLDIALRLALQPAAGLDLVQVAVDVDL
jgi:thiol-disulfide isomerase/thioredoxin